MEGMQKISVEDESSNEEGDEEREKTAVEISV